MKKIIVLGFILFLMGNVTSVFADSVNVHIKEVTIQYLNGGGNNLSCIGSNDVNYMFYFGEDATKISIAKMLLAELLFAKSMNLTVKLEYEPTAAGSLIKTIRVDPRY